MSIKEFYTGKEFFITGATGFLGKSFVEKLLRFCPDVSKIYLLIREKRNKTPQERLKELSKDLVFERLHREQPQAFDKIVAIVGDCTKLGLGISAEDVERLKNVHIIVHGAANVRFDTTLRSTILMNTRGTHELIKIALTLKHLIAFTHVSTAYISPFQSFIKEEMCEAPVPWRSAIKIAETLDDDTLECLAMKYSGFPNAYSFTKNLSEQVVAEFSDRLPITILRPSVVSHALKEPEPGYLDNLNGHVGLLVGISIGIAPMAYCNQDVNVSIITVDTITNCTIVATYSRGLESIKSKKCGLDIRNLTPGKIYELTTGQSIRILLKHVREEPLEQTLWAPSEFTTTNYYLFMLNICLMSIPMALIYDALLKFSKKEAIVMKLIRKFVNGSKHLEKFGNKHFEFQNDRMLELADIVPEEDRSCLNLDYINGGLDLDTTIMHLRDGLKKYIFKQPLKSTPATQRRFKIFVIADKMITFFIFSVAVLVLWKIIN